MNSIFEFDHFSYRYRKQGNPILSDITLSVNEGEITAVVGKSGSGKTTFASVLSGVIPGVVSSGVMEGRAEKTKDVFIGLVTQSPESQLFGYTVEDAIAFGLENQNVPRKDIEQRLSSVLDLLHISHLRHRVVERLSGGQKQAVCIASVLIMEPDLLVLDEPVSSLDPKGKALVQDILLRLREAGQSVIILDQFIDWCASCVDRVIGMEEGKLIFEGDLLSFLKDQELYERLGVTVPQAAELYHRMKESTPDFPLCWDIEDLAKRLSGRVQLRNDAPEKKALMPGPECLTATHLRHCYGEFEALSDVNASFRKGTVTTILGQNGSGKTTFVHHINGLLSPTSGDIEIDGHSISGQSVAELSRKVSLIFQNPDQMLFEDTVAEEIQFSRKQHGDPVNADETLRLLKEAGMEGYEKAFPLNLSMGQKHMVTILGSVASGAGIVIFDEPTLGMDLGMKRYLIQLIQGIRDEGVCVILISHELSFVCEVSDTILLLHDGRIIYAGDRDSAFGQRDLFSQMKMPLPDMEILSDRLGLGKTFLTTKEFADGVLIDGKEVRP